MLSFHNRLVREQTEISGGKQAYVHENKWDKAKERLTR